jgi:hypothetical protein
MSNFITILQLIAQIYPVIVQTIKAIEESIPVSGMGSAKLQLVKSTLESAYKSMEGAQVTFEQLWPTVQVIVSSVVAMYNAAGVFKKTA